MLIILTYHNTEGPNNILSNVNLLCSLAQCQPFKIWIQKIKYQKKWCNHFVTLLLNNNNVMVKKRIYSVYLAEVNSRSKLKSLEFSSQL